MPEPKLTITNSAIIPIIKGLFLGLVILAILWFMREK